MNKLNDLAHARIYFQKMNPKQRLKLLLCLLCLSFLNVLYLNPISARAESDSGISGVAMDKPVTIGDRVWIDRNGNGLQDDGEKGVANVTVELLDSDGMIITTMKTDLVGTYKFENLEAGTYVVRFQQPEGYFFTKSRIGNNDKVDSDADPNTGESDPFGFQPGDTDLTIDAGVYQPASVGDFVWNDQDMNGLQDDGEAGVDGLIATLFTGDDVEVDSTSTQDGGYYQFTDLAPGRYYIIFSNLPDGFLFGPKDRGNDDSQDSDVNEITGRTDIFVLSSADERDDIDVALKSLTAAIDVEVSTNGEDADDPTGPAIALGDKVVWEYVVTNIGNVLLTDIFLLDSQLGDITENCPDDVLAIGQSMTCIMVGEAEAGQYMNTASVEAVVIIEDQADQIVSDSDKSHYLGKDENTDLSITKSDDADPMVAGDDLHYTITYENNGPSDAVEVRIVDTLPIGVAYEESSSQDTGLVGPSMTNLPDGRQQLLWTIRRLPAGSTNTITLRANTDLTLAGSTVVNIIEISSETPETNTANNEDEEATTFKVSGTGEQPSAIELLSFMASEQQGQIEVRWVTAAEVDTWGYRLYRSTDSWENAALVTEEMITSQGSQGGEYTFIDDGAIAGVNYLYWLVEVENGVEQPAFGPVNAQITSATFNAPFSLFLPTINR